MRDDAARFRYLLRGFMRLGAMMCAVVLAWQIVLHSIETHRRTTTNIRVTRNALATMQNLPTTHPLRQAPPTVPNYATSFASNWFNQRFLPEWNYPWPRMIPWALGAGGLWVLQKRVPRMVFPEEARGVCGSCGYEMGEAKRCPECGKG